MAFVSSVYPSKQGGSRRGHFSRRDEIAIAAYGKMLAISYIVHDFIGERAKRARHYRDNRIGDICLFVYMCGCTSVILYFDPHIFTFARRRPCPIRL